MEPTRKRGPGFPYDPDHDYSGFVVQGDLDGPLLDTRAASSVLGLQSQQAVRNLIAQGRLPALRGDQPVHPRRYVPAWAAHGLAKHRFTGAAGASPSGPTQPVHDDRRAATADADMVGRSDAETERLRAEVARLRGENSDLRYAWAMQREVHKLLTDAEADREEALAALRTAERKQADSAAKLRRAAELERDALSNLIMPKDAAGA